MTNVHPSIYLIPLAYLLGSVPFGVLVVKPKGVDLRKVGSGNIGATNVLRTAGRGAAVMTLLGDFLKGSVSVVLARILIKGDFWEGVIGISAVLGHIFSVFLSFKGGKGVATGFGVLSVYSPLAAIMSIGIWGFTAAITKYSSLAAIVSFIALPVVCALLDVSRIKILFAIILSLLIISKHRENIKRLFAGTEGKIGEEPKT